MRRVGTLSFTLKGQPLTLGAFVEADQADMRRLFVPFGDLTNGVGNLSGRPLPRARSHGDGHLRPRLQPRYHPFCFYNPTYDCPYPPRGEPLEGADPRRANRLVERRTAETLTPLMMPVRRSSSTSTACSPTPKPLHLRGYQEMLAPHGIKLTQRTTARAISASTTRGCSAGSRPTTACCSATRRSSC